MKKYIITIMFTAATALAVNTVKKDKPKPSTTRPAKGEMVATDRSFVTCPRVTSDPDFIPTGENDAAYSHCSKCQIGAFLKRENKLVCTYCENSAEAALP